MNQHPVLCFVFIAALAPAAVSCARARPAATAPQWTLAWQDEFNGAAGTAPDTNRWSHDTGDGCSAGICGWGNDEKEYYTSTAENISLDGRGHLAIVARPALAGMTCSYGPCRYTSGRITTRGKVRAEPGRVEARIRLPAGQGLWPAFWLLGSSHPGTPWPLCGELDVMENHGSRPDATSSAIHGPGYSGQTPFVHGYSLPSGTFADDYHAFAVEWDTAQVRFFVDGALHFAVSRGDVDRYGAWVFDQPFSVILNLAVGGTFDGDLKSDAILPATMLVDYVRVYVPSSAPVGAVQRVSRCPGNVLCP